MWLKTANFGSSQTRYRSGALAAIGGALGECCPWVLADQIAQLFNGFRSAAVVYYQQRKLSNSEFRQKNAAAAAHADSGVQQCSVCQSR